MDVKGKLIVIEGLDGCGKETQIRLLREKLPDVVVFKYPTLRYMLLKDYLEQKIELAPKALFLLFLADIAEDQKNVKKALSEKKIVILDRYVSSTISYEVTGIDYNRCKQVVECVKYLGENIRADEKDSSKILEAAQKWAKSKQTVSALGKQLGVE